MKISALALILSFLFQSPLFAQKKAPVIKTENIQKVLGQLIKPKKELNLPFEYYITVQKSDGKVLAFPLEAKVINLNLMFKNQFYYMDVVPREEVLTVGEKKQKFTVMQLKSAKLLSLKDLKPNTDTSRMERKAQIREQGKPDFRINDTITNAAIFTAGALLLGSMLTN